MCMIDAGTLQWKKLIPHSSWVGFFYCLNINAYINSSVLETKAFISLASWKELMRGPLGHLVGVREGQILNKKAKMMMWWDAPRSHHVSRSCGGCKPAKWKWSRFKKCKNAGCYHVEIDPDWWWDGAIGAVQDRFTSCCHVSRLNDVRNLAFRRWTPVKESG